MTTIHELWAYRDREGNPLVRVKSAWRPWGVVGHSSFESLLGKMGAYIDRLDERGNQQAQPTTFEERCAAILEHYGERTQCIKSIEELAELIVVLGRRTSAWHKFSRNEAAIIDEIADVRIMVEQLKQIYGRDKVQKRIGEKLDRVERRMRGGE